MLSGMSEVVNFFFLLFSDFCTLCPCAGVCFRTNKPVFVVHRVALCYYYFLYERVNIGVKHVDQP